MNFNVILAAGGIALINIVLSGDNALVIGAAASHLPRSQRLFAIIWGGAAALVLRLILSVVATELFQIPLLQLTGGLIIFVLAVRLLLPQGEDPTARQAHDRLLPAILTILVADVTMSLDNVLAIGALAGGNIPLLVIGLVSSMLLLFAASAFIARLMERLTWLIDLASIVLAWTAANLILGDPKTLQTIHLGLNQQLAVHLGLVALILLIDIFIRAAVAHSGRQRPKTGQQSTGKPPEQGATSRDSAPSL